MAVHSGEIYLKTKLIQPQVRSRRVLRGRLTDRLAGAFSVPLTLVCAPAGYGKTTLLVDWAQNCRAPVAWLTLDEDDNDPARFLSYLIIAMQQIKPGLGKAVEVLLTLPETDLMENSLRLLVNDLAGLESPAVLVLDDYHCITARPVHQMLGFLVEHLPPAFHIVIASRTEPAIALARLRGRSAVLELRAAELSFRPEETEDFLNQVMQLDLSAQACDQLVEQTEGWAAGLQLAALSLRSGEGSLAPDALRSGQHYIFDYLAAEVLARLPEAMQRFLMHTAILDQLNGPLCDALVEPFPPYTTGADCLDALEHANLFTQALDGEHAWYRYHALFADFLRERLKQAGPECIADLHGKAARWLADKGNFEGACKHAVASKDQNLLIWLIETNALELEKQGELVVLARWINVLPEEVVRAHPRICLVRAWVFVARLDVQNAALYLDLAGQGMVENESPALRSEMLAARAFLAGMNDHSDELDVYAKEAFRLLPDTQHFLYGLLKINMSFPPMLSGRVEDAIQLLEDGITVGIQSNSMVIAIIGMRILGEAYMINGRLYQAERIFLRMLAYIEALLGKKSPVRGVAMMGLGEVYHQRNELEKADQYLTEGLEKTMAWMPAMGMDGFMWLSALKQAMGQPAEAQLLLQQARQVNETSKFPMLDGWFIASASAKLDILQGYLEESLRWARSTGLDLDTLDNLDQLFADTPAHFRKTCYYALARLFLILGRREGMPGALEKAARVLAYVLPLSEAAGTFSYFLEGLLLSAQVQQALGNEQAAQNELHRALDLAAPEQQLRVFLSEGESVRNMLVERRKWALPEQERVFIDQILAGWGAETGKPQAAEQLRAGLVEPLSFRELEVLRRMAAGNSNQEIADTLVLSLNTVKKHVSTIMSKLQAKNRFQAVLAARQMGLMNDNQTGPL